MIKTWKKNIFSNKKLENIKENQVELKNIITENLKYMIRNQGFPDD